MEVSLVIPSYNRYELLKRALESVFSQSTLPTQIIVVDDGSSDATAAIQKDFPSVEYYYQENSGVSSARNLGILHAKYKWITFLDSDDTWHDEKLQTQIAFHKNNPDILMSYTDEVWIRNDKQVKIPKKFRKIGVNAFVENLSYCNIAPSSVCLHRSLLEKYALFDTSLEVCEDYDLWLRIALHEKIALIDKQLITKYAGHENQLSFKHWGMDRFRVQTLEKILEDASQRQKRQISEELIKKYRLLSLGALKYDKIQVYDFYQEKLNILLKKEAKADEL